VRAPTMPVTMAAYLSGHVWQTLKSGGDPDETLHWKDER
jgi:hypothetical protein